jgi:glutathione S-transferase
VVKITLYGSARTPFTEKVRRALLYKRLAFELCEPTSAEDYKRWNPKSGMLPVLHLDDGGALEMIEDSTAIVYALDERHPDPPLLAVDPTVASQQRQLAKWSDESFLWYFLKYRRMIGAGEMQLPVASDVERPAPGVGEEESSSGSLRRFAAWLRAGGTWERPITGLLREIGLRLDDLVNFLGARPYFYSEHLSVADLGVYSMLFTLRNGSIPGTERLLAVRPSLVAFMARVEEETSAASTAAS